MKAFGRFWPAFDKLFDDLFSEVDRELREEFKDVPAGTQKVEETTTKETKDGVTIVTKTTKTWIRR